MSVKILHNPRCSKSRQTLSLLEERGIEPIVVEYLKTPPSKEELQDILAKLALSPRELMRKGEAEYKDNNLADDDLSDEQLIDAMIQCPKLIERPIVISNGKVRIGRPPESVLEIV
ncbi:MAG: arsenate reductase (glutaredoxin) [Sneathiella sp.]|nr:arsenate reductase (glutaredoxin) [Sneathiella sp.]